jgi:hypothetical protein
MLVLASSKNLATPKESLSRHQSTNKPPVPHSSSEFAKNLIKIVNKFQKGAQINEEESNYTMSHASQPPRLSGL